MEQDGHASQRPYTANTSNHKYNRDLVPRSFSTLSDDGGPPVFNKRLFVSQGSVVITDEAKRIMAKNARGLFENMTSPFLSKSELLAMRCVVDGLRLIHRVKDYIKDCLSNVVTYETYAANQYVLKQESEDCLSCYYIVHGAVEVTHGLNVPGDQRNVYNPDLKYNHATGEYLGLISPEGRGDDIAPPATVFTTECCEFLRIDREKFHAMIDRMLDVLGKEKEQFVRSGKSFLSTLPKDVKDKILAVLLKQEYPPNRIIVNQGEMTDHLHIIVAGRCEATRKVFVEEVDRGLTFDVTYFTEGMFFAEECVLERRESTNTVITTSATVCYKLPRSALEIVSRERLTKTIQDQRNQYPSDERLQENGYLESVWCDYKNSAVKQSLCKAGKEQHLLEHTIDYARIRPPTASELKKENLFRFMMKGSQMQPVRVRSAARRPRKAPGVRSLPVRPKSAMTGVTSISKYPSDVSIMTPEERPTRPESSETASSRYPTDRRRRSKVLYESISRLLEKQGGNANSAVMQRLIEGTTDLPRDLKYQYLTHQQEELEKSFMDQGLLAVMNADEIVKKAKAAAENFADKTRRHKLTAGEAENGEEWCDILRTENEQAKICIDINRRDIDLLRRRLDLLDKRRQCEVSNGRMTQLLGRVDGRFSGPGRGCVTSPTYQDEETRHEDVVTSMLEEVDGDGNKKISHFKVKARPFSAMVSKTRVADIDRRESLPARPAIPSSTSLNAMQGSGHI